MSTGIDVDYFQKIIKKLETQVEYADIRVRNSINNSLVLKDGKIDNIDTGINYAIGIRVLQNGAWGSAFTSEIDKVEEAAQNATTIANQLKSDVELTQTNPQEDIVKSKAKIKIEDVTIEEKIETMQELHKISLIDQIQSTNISLSESQSSDLIISSEGTNILSDNNRTVLSMNAVASNGEVMQIGHKSLGGVQGFEIINNADLESFATGISQKAISLLDAQTPPSGDFPVILDPELAGVFIHEALGHASEADIILQNDSILKDKLGQKLVQI